MFYVVRVCILCYHVYAISHVTWCFLVVFVSTQVVETVAYICTHYAESHVQQQSVPKRKHEKQPISSQPLPQHIHEHDQDEEYTYDLITPTGEEGEDEEEEMGPITPADGAILIFCPGWDDINKLVEV